MPKGARRAHPAHALDAASDSSDEEPTIGIERYQSAEIAEGLSNRRNRIRALRELNTVLEQLYRAAPKQVQLAVFEDILAAVKVLDRRALYLEELKKLVKLAQKLLPQQKRNLILKEHKAARLAQQRSGRKSASSSTGPSSPQDEDDEDDELIFGHLPSQVVQTIFCHLDPISLAAATCVSKEWMMMSHDCDSWRCWVEAFSQQRTSAASGAATLAADNRTGGLQSVPRQSQIWHKRFRSIVQGRSALLLPWQSDRVLLNGRLSWQGMQDGMAWLRLHSQPSARQQRTARNPVPLSVTQVISWLTGQRVDLDTQLHRRDSSSDSSDADDDEEDNISRPMKLWNFRI